MNQRIIDTWNSTVKPGDHVYCGGDFGNPELANLLHGRKTLILGNHDIPIEKYVGKFKKILLWRKWKIDDVQFVHTHIPIHMTCDNVPGKRSYQFNVHGHIHEKIVMNGKQPDLRYLNICVEHTNYTPVNLDDLVQQMKQRQKLLAS